jgi:iron complex outermembrane receptor protein
MQLKPSNLHTGITKALALSACMTIGFAANAQEAENTDNANNAKKQGFETITVTAQKRVENLNEVPIAVSVLREDQINSAFSANIEGLQALVPSVSFR